MDGQQIITWALGIATTLFGGLNIFQWITLRSYKRVKAAEADRQEIENLRIIISEMRGEITRLRERVDRAEENASENYRRYISLQSEFEQYKKEHK